ncbi:MAG: FxLYD domain-containing protein [Dehalococcoidia bacterium]
MRLTNNTDEDLRGLTICANLRAPDGRLLEVGNSYVRPSSLARDESVTAIIYFNSFPADANVEFFPQANRGCCAVPKIDARDIRFESTQIVTGASGGRFLLVAASAVNTTGLTFDASQFDAYVEGSAGDRIEYATAGCDGVMGAGGEPVPMTFLLPLPGSAASPTPVISGIEGRVAQFDYHRLRTRNVRRDGNTVGGTIVNDTDRRLWVSGVCFVLREQGGQLLGSAATSPQVPLEPGESVTLEAIVPSTVDPEVAEIIAYGDDAPRVPPPS